MKWEGKVEGVVESGRVYVRELGGGVESDRGIREQGPEPGCALYGKQLEVERGILCES